MQTPAPAPAPAEAPARRFNYPAVAAFVLSLLSFSIGVFDIRWMWGLIFAVVGLALGIFGVTRSGGRGWGVAAILVSALFIVLTWVLSMLLGIPFSTFLRI